ncbi:class I SAM-dependent methyltransferase [uncultured Jatrophihabitans sp.]|uniref:class I SAM-dependent methyltransferase n=1 Tax=uncultured Jatrophihabitans sp. TaxID=1610747 RepID=UPI0035CA13B7
MSDASEAEFGTMAAWTADAAQALGPDHFVPAGCRGSGGPSALDWFLHHLDVGPETMLLDVGAGVGGPAGYARKQRGASALLVEPELAACHAARTLFDVPTACADAAALPLPDASFDVVWCLAVLCTTADQPAVMHELRRVLTPSGRLGMLVYVAAGEVHGPPEGNDFPTEEGFAQLCAGAGLTVVERTALSHLPDAPAPWTARERAVRDLIADDHGEDEAWREAARQEKAIGMLIGSGAVIGQLFVLSPTS